MKPENEDGVRQEQAQNDSSLAQPTPDSIQTNRDRRKNKHRTDGASPTLNFPFAFDAVAVLVMLATVTNSYLAYRTLKELVRTNDLTRNAVDLTRAQLEQDATRQRAWLGITGDRPIAINLDPLSGEMRLAVPITNTGETPALNIRVRFFAIAGPINAQPPVGKLDELQLPFESTSILLPKAFITSASTYTWKNAAAILQDVKGGKQRIYVFGRVNYADTTGTPHLTEFCFFWGTMNALVNCESFNNAK